MDVDNALNELRDELELVDDAIKTLERIAATRGKRRGRPPAWLIAAKIDQTYSDER